MMNLLRSLERLSVEDGFIRGLVRKWRGLTNINKEKVALILISKRFDRHSQ
jgi:hypothetical protein